MYLCILFDGSLNITFILETLDGQIKKETLQGKKLCLEDDVKEGYLNIEGTIIPFTVGRRPKKDMMNSLNLILIMLVEYKN